MGFARGQFETGGASYMRERSSEDSRRRLIASRSLRIGAPLWLVSAFALGGSVTALAQKVFTAKELKVVEKTVGPYFDATTAAVMAGDYETAKIKLIVTREYLARSWTFWNINRQAAAAKMVSGAVATLDTLDDLLSATPVDADAVRSAVARAAAACTACHAAFRVQDPITKAYGIKPGVIVETARPDSD
jgi:hypothetical protein